MPNAFTHKISNGSDVTLKGYLTTIMNIKYSAYDSYEDLITRLNGETEYQQSILDDYQEKLETLRKSTDESLLIDLKNENKHILEQRQKFFDNRAKIRNNYIKVYNELEKVQQTKELRPILQEAYEHLNKSLEHDAPICKNYNSSESSDMQIELYDENNIEKYRLFKERHYKYLIDKYREEVSNQKEHAEYIKKEYKALYDLIHSL